MTDVWSRFWEGFVNAVDLLNGRVRPDDHGFVSQIQRTSNDIFPLRALVSYAPATAPGDERLVVSLDFKREGPNVVGHADLARGDGLVLDEAEILQSFPEHALATSAADVEAAEAAVTEFVTRQQGVLSAELRGQHDASR